MNPTLKKIIPLIVILVGLGALATWDDWKTKQEEKKKSDENMLFKFDIAAVESFEYFNNGEADGEHSDDTKKQKAAPLSMNLKKVDGRWLITSPVEAPADATTVENILKAVSDFKYEKVLSEAKSDWGQYGLTSPRRSLKITLSGQQPVTVFLGMNAPVGYSSYLATSQSDRVLLGGQHISASLTRTLFEMRDKAFVDFQTSDISKVVYQPEKGAALEFARVDGVFQIQQPEKFDTDSSTVTSFLDDLKSLRVAEFFDVPVKAQQERFASKAPLIRVSWTDSKGATKTILFSQGKDDLFASFDPKIQIVKLEANAKTKIIKSASDFRNKRVFRFMSAQAVELDIDGKIYKKVKDNWYSAEDAGKFNDKGDFLGKKDEEPKVKISARTLLIDLEYAKAEDFLALTDPVASSLNSPPKHKIVLRFNPESGLQPLTIEAWVDPKNSEKYFIKHSSGSYIYRVTRGVLSSASEEASSGANAKTDKTQAPGSLDLNAPPG